MRISCRRRQSDASPWAACAPQLLDNLGALVKPFTDRLEIWCGGRYLFWMCAPSDEHSPLHHLLGRSGSSEVDHQLLVHAAQHGAAARLGQHLPLAGEILAGGARPELCRGHPITHENALNSKTDRRTEVIQPGQESESHAGPHPTRYPEDSLIRM